MISHQPAVRVIAEAGRGREAIDEFLSAHPDKAVMDLRMPVLDGFEAKTAVFQNDPAARVVFVTAFGTEEDVYPVLRRRKDMFRRVLPRSISSRVSARYGMGDMDSS